MNLNNKYWHGSHGNPLYSPRDSHWQDGNSWVRERWFPQISPLLQVSKAPSSTHYPIYKVHWVVLRGTWLLEIRMNLGVIMDLLFPRPRANCQNSTVSGKPKSDWENVWSQSTKTVSTDMVKVKTSLSQTEICTRFPAWLFWGSRLSNY